MKKYSATPALALIPDYNKREGKPSIDDHTEHALKLRINYKRKRKYFGTKFKFTTKDWEQINQVKPPKRFLDNKNRIDKVLNRAKQIIEEMENGGHEFTFKRFETLWYQVKPKGTQLHDLFKECYYKLKDEQPKTASQYKLSYLSIYKFLNKDTPAADLDKKDSTTYVRYADVTVDFLNQYEKWMLAGADDKEEEKKPRSKTTIGMYCRCVRAIFNKAQERGIIKKEIYPFGKGKYVIPTGKNVKKALTAEEVGALASYVAASEQEQRARDMFMLSFYCNGGNFKDLCKLRFRNINNGQIRFFRNKTLRTTKDNPKQVTIIITDELQAILSRWENPDKSSDNYILPVLSKGLTTKREDDLIEQFIKDTNKYLKRIGDNLGLGKHVTTYVARHSYATILRDKGVSIEFISEALGHTSILTTQRYLADFPTKAKKEYAQTLIDAIRLPSPALTN
jgi:integrase/recombinase XerD